MTQQTPSPKPTSSQTVAPAALRVSSIAVRNFRLLRKADIDLDLDTTVLVGRNNSGKTTLAEALVCFLQVQAPTFSAADFSVECYEQFYLAWKSYIAGKETEARERLPEISLTMKIKYSADIPEYGPLAALIVDLDPECTDAILRFTYSLRGGRLAEFFEGTESELEPAEVSPLEALLGWVNQRIPKLFHRTISAIDPNDPTNTREITVQSARDLVSVHFLKAQRGLDDEKDRPKDPIGKVFQSLFEAATNADDGTTQKTTADELTGALSEIEEDLGRKVTKMMTGITPALRNFGYPGLNDPGLVAATKLDVERLLANYTSIRYRGVAGVSLPESYSGLGSRNLILILLTLLGYYREFASRGNTPGLHLIFIEEPEAHLHPQMQEVFIEQLANVAGLFPSLDTRTHSWRPQFVVSTHSSHVANRADFSAIRYFRVVESSEQTDGSHVDVLDLSTAPGLDTDFLHQYLTLTRSDLFFADKAILVEGTSERLIVPVAIRNTEPKFTNQYVTLMEVGGAYAHIFFPLLDFLGIPTLVITDIDTIGPREGKKRDASTTVHEGHSTSNATIKDWFPEVEDQTPQALLKAAKSDAIIHGNRYLAYQVPEDDEGACGRTFEDSFILANPESNNLELTGDVNQDEVLARDLAGSLKKSEFAIRFAIKETSWRTPRYIQLGLDWLLAHPVLPAQPESVESTGEVAVR